MSEDQKNRELPINIFYSYTQEDEASCLELEKHLGLLRREGKIVEWSKRKLLAGDHSANELDQKLAVGVGATLATLVPFGRLVRRKKVVEAKITTRATKEAMMMIIQRLRSKKLLWRNFSSRSLFAVFQ